jgi:hypothetical protein
MAATGTTTSTKPASGGDAITKITTEAFVQAFNKQRTTLAGFSKCSNKEELEVVRDGFYLGLAKDLCPDAYKAVLILVLRKRFSNVGKNDSKQDGIVEEGDQGMLSMSFEEMVLAARACDQSGGEKTKTIEPKGTDSKNDETKDNATTTAADDVVPTTYWKDLVETILKIGNAVGSDLESIWKILEDGRLNWLRAVSAAHPIKVLLKKALEVEGAVDSAGDVSDAMMVWIYSICLGLAEGDSSKPETEEEASAAKDAKDAARKQMGIAVDSWATAVNMIDKHNPLKGYQAELWDPRRDEWRALDLGAQEAAESGGANILEAWKA